jgi:hypothetical protein
MLAWTALIRTVAAIDLLQPVDGRLAVHEFSHRPAECLEIFCAAMGFDRCLIGVALHEHIGIRDFTMS